MKNVIRYRHVSVFTGQSLRRFFRYVLQGHSLALFGLMVVFPVFSSPGAEANPEPPARIHNIHLVDDDGDFSYPHIPGMRTTNDGRVAIKVESWNLQAFLLVPEKLNGPWRQSSRGTSTILSSPRPFREGINFGRSMSHQTMCDTTTAFPSAGDASNPYVCGADDANDCYAIASISTVSDSDGRKRLVNRPLTIEVADPKTVEARIVDVRQGADTFAGQLMPTTEFFEPVTSEDGRLLMGRFSRTLDMSFTNARTGQEHTGKYDLVYSLLEDDAEDCDVRGWQRWYPISHAHHDPRMRAAGYGIAKFPVRTSEGVVIPETQDLGVTYPWMDRKGANIFFTSVSSLLGQEEAKYPNRCVPGLPCIYREHTGNLRGVSVLGSWTRGKHVHIDNLLNNTDWGLPLDPQGHRMVRMYDNPENGSNEEIRVGSGGRFKYADFPGLPGRSNNSAIIDSVENSFFQFSGMKTATPRDVVWNVSNGKATDEFAFDDYINPDSFIVSNMIASISQSPENSWSYYENGFHRSSGFSRDVHLQNGATATPDRWRIPSYGLVSQGTGRVEPIALGGIHGRGFWLDGGNEINYKIGPQPRDPASSSWYVGIFVDSRFANDEQQRSLIKYPDGTSLRLQGRQQLLLMRDDTIVHEVTLPEPVPRSGWSHVGLNLDDGNRNVTVLYNGYALEDVRIEEGFLKITEGDLVVGGSGGFRGWVDDFKVFAQKMNPELACNHAGGTLIGVDANSEWQAVADRYPQSSHGAIAQRVSASGRQTSSRFACYTNYQDTHGIDVNVIPAGTVSIREALNFPEGPVVHDQPRPDSTQNQFCLSCHTSQSTDGLSLTALALDASLMASDDPRRQPNQHLRMVHGNIPEGWLNGRVARATQAGREGFLLDPVLLDQQPPSDVNLPPDVVQPANQTHAVSTRVSLQIEATDDADAVLQYSATNLPTGLLINESTGAISGIPTNEQESLVTVTVSDGELQSAVSFTWNIGEEPVAGLCGSPRVDPAVDGGVHVWKECDGGPWSLMLTGPAETGAVRASGRITSEAGLASVTPRSLESSDKLTSTDPLRTDFKLTTGNPWNDRFEFTVPDGASFCLGLEEASGGQQLHIGPNRIPAGAGPIDPVSLQSCEFTGPDCPAPRIDTTTDSGLFVWKNCDGLWSVLLTGVRDDGGVARVVGDIESTDGFLSISPKRLESSDTLSTELTLPLDFDMRTTNPWRDDFDFAVPSGADLCVNIVAIDAGVGIFAGPDRTPVGRSFNPETFADCA